MNVDKVVTIGREYGSGGRVIGQLLAEMLHVPFFDKEVLTRAAKESGICEDLFEQYDEKATPSYLFSMGIGLNVPPDPSGLGIHMPLNHRIFLAQFEAITKIASEGSCVIVGRCGDYVLKERENTIKVFLYADTESRVERIMEVEKVPRERAKEMVRKVDKQRQHYYNFFADGNWGHRSNYDLMLRTDGMTISDTAKLIRKAVEQYQQKI